MRRMTLTDSDWDIRLFIYQALAAGGRPPDADDLALQFGISPSQARNALRRLHDAHALVLRAGSSDILMANPLSALPTAYRVMVDETALYANCAWDALGIPAMLGADARIEARHPLDDNVIELAVEADQLRSCHDHVVHFALPFRQWYEDIVDT